MKLNREYVVRKIGSDYFAVAVSVSAGNQQMIKLNETAAFLFGLCCEEFTAESLATALLEKYTVTEEKAKADVDALIASMTAAGLLRE